MPVYDGINGVVRKRKEWPVGIDGVVRQQKEHWAGIDGVNRQIFSAGTKVGDLEIGDIVSLNVNGAPTDFIVVNQGIPSSMYDSSCDGTWLLMKDLYTKRKWHNVDTNSYKESTIHAYLNDTFLNLFEADIREAIKQVKIPYVNGTADAAVASGANGLSCKIFLLSGKEVGWDSRDNPYFPNDGAKLSYFTSGNSSAANNKRIANYNGSATYWWLRSPFTDLHVYAWVVNRDGGYNSSFCSNSYGIRPALILPSNFLI